MINEACQVWIEQRIKEELEGDGEKSLREIGRVIASEIEKVFDAKVRPETLAERARVMKRDRNLSAPVTPSAPTVEPGDSGDKIGPEKIVATKEGGSRVTPDPALSLPCRGLSHSRLRNVFT